jgi:uncharacterized protein (TIGR00661 family)
MKIFYAVQATGNGHISRAGEIMPFLQKVGKVDVFLSGSNHSLKNNLPIAYRSKGLSLFYNSDGGVDLQKTIGSIKFKKIWNEAKFLPIEKYDLVINDFECITSLACWIKKIPSIHFGHQASFQSDKTPRPKKKEFIGEWVLKNYAKGTDNIGLHFNSYDKNIFSPIIKSTILNTDPIDDGHITVYLNHFSDEKIIEQLKNLKHYRFELFSSNAQMPYSIENIKVLPVNKELFNQSLITCHGIITGAGFETPAEALYLEKKLMVIPLKGQYEQKCNAAALEKFNVSIIEYMDEDFCSHFEKWIENTNQLSLSIKQHTEEIIEVLLSIASKPMKDKINIEDFSINDSILNGSSWMNLREAN